MVEAKDQSFSINVISTNISQEIVLDLTSHVFFVNLVRTLWKTVQHYYKGFRRRDCDRDLELNIIM